MTNIQKTIIGLTVAAAVLAVVFGAFVLTATPQSGIAFVPSVAEALGGDSGCCNTPTDDDDDKDRDVKPRCSLSANKTTINAGESATLTWSSSKARRITLDGNSVSKSGTKVVSPNQTTTYSIRVTSRTNDHKTCRVTITVKEPKAPVCTISISDRTPDYGGNTTISWTSKHAERVRLSSVGLVADNGSHTFTNITSSEAYTITVTGKDGSKKTCTKTVVPKDQVKNPRCTIHANPSSVYEGGSSTITWTSANADSATISHIGSVALNSSASTGSLYNSRTYTMTVYGNGKSNTCQTTVDVYDEPEYLNCSLWANPNSVSENGYTTLSWNSNGAHSASIDSIGSVSLNGSQNVYPGHSRTYTMTVWGNNGSKTCTTYVTVNTQSNLWCTINASQQYNNGSVQLNWSSNGTAAWISEGVGTVSPNGTKTVYAQGHKTYTLTVTNGTQTKTCSTNTYMGGTTYVSLTQIPYTGLDFGLVGTMLYWALLATGVVAAGYVVTMYRGGILAFVPAGLGFASTDEDEEDEVEEEEILTEEVVEDNERRVGESLALTADGTAPRIVIRG